MRIFNFRKASEPSNDDYLVIDGQTNGTRSILARLFATKSTKYKTTIKGSDWTGTEPYWENIVSVPGITANTNVDVTLDEDTPVADSKICQQQQIVIGKAMTGAIQFKSLADTKPTVDIPIICLIRGD